MYPKPTRVIDKKLRTSIVKHRDGICMIGLDGNTDLCTLGVEPHHITSVGAGGGDVKENIITLCRKHHNAVHNAEISADYLREILSGRYGYNY